ncbi:MAG: RNA polymerase sigma factor [Acidobacteriota bacterium]
MAEDPARPEEWAAAARRGDESAFERLLKHYYAPLFRTIFQIVPQSEDVEDILQEAFFRFYRSLGTLRPGEDPYPYLKTIAVRRAYSHLRRHRVHASLEEIPQDLPQLRVAGRPTDLRRVYSWAETLPAQRRLVFLLREVLGQPDSEVAVLLGIREATVRRHASLAREALEKALNRGGGAF